MIEQLVLDKVYYSFVLSTQTSFQHNVQVQVKVKDELGSKVRQLLEFAAQSFFMG